MTFLAPAEPADIGAIRFFGRRTPKPKDRLRIADEDVARRAIGADGSVPPPALAGGSSLEHLARIALG